MLGKETGRNFVATYRGPLIVGALLIGALVADYRLRDTPSSSYAVGMSQLEAGHFDAAARELGRALRDNPNDAAARLALARAYDGLGWTEEAAKQYEMAAQKSGETLRLSYAGLATVSEKLGHKDDARRYSRAASQLRLE